MSAEMVDLSTGEIRSQIRLDEIIVGERARKEYGDLDSLIESIRTHGLLQPIGLTDDNRLIFGGRRLEACRRLGWQYIACTRPQTLADTLALLTAERDENTCRKEMTPSELVALGKAIEEQERPRAVSRQGHRSDLDDDPELRRNGTTKLERTRTDDVVGAGLGISGSNYGRAKRLVEAASQGDPSAAEAVERMDRTGAITPAYNAWKGRQSAPSGHPPKIETPDPTDKSREAVAARVQLAKELAGTGRTSHQIADAIGLSFDGTRLMMRREGIDVPADKIVGRRRQLDSNRIVEQTVLAMEGHALGVGLIDFEQLDPAKVAGWSSSLSASLQSLNRLSRQLKELDQP